MLNKNNILRFLIVVLFLSSIAIATETTWRHSGFEISGYDINGSSTYNLTEIRKIEFGWNSTIPAVSETSRAVMYYDDNQKRIMQSLNGGAYQAIVTNATVDFQIGNASNLTVGVLRNASIPASAANISKSNAFTAEQTFSTAIVGDLTNGSTATSTGASNKFTVAQSVSKLHNRSYQLTAFFGTNDSTSPLGVSIGVNGSTSADNSRWSYIDSSEINLGGRPLVLQGVSGNKVVVSDGSLNINPLTRLQVMGLTSSTGTTIVADANGNFYLLTSSEAGKRNISIVTDSINWSRLQNVPIKQYEYTTKNLTRNQSSSIGFTVESLYAAGLYDLINFDDEGKPFSIKYDVLAAYQQGQINSLSKKINQIPKYTKLPNTYPIGGEAYNTTDNTLNIMKADGWYIVQTTRRE